MKHTTTDRGFKHLEPIEGDYGGHVKVYESSSAEQPKLWLQIAEPNDINAWCAGDQSGGTHDATIHLTADNAWQLKEQLEWALEHHYHGDARPDPEEAARAAQERQRAIEADLDEDSP